MKKKGTKKPTIKKFKKVCEDCKGVISNIAAALGVTRRIIYYWCADDPEFQDCIDEFKGKMLDDCLKSAKVLATGIPDIDQKTGRFKGWKEKPDGSMLRYFISTLGRKEGYGESLDITTNGKDLKPEKIVIEMIDKTSQVEKSKED